MSWKDSRKKEIQKLFELIETKYSIAKEELISKSRKKKLVAARKLFMNLLYELYEIDNMTHTDISKIINLDRTSFIHHRNAHLNEYDRYKDYKRDYDCFKKEFETLLK